MRPLLIASASFFLMISPAVAQVDPYQSGYDDAAQGMGPVSGNARYNSGYYDGYDDAQSMAEMQRQDRAQFQQFQDTIHRLSCQGMPAGTDGCS